MAPKKIYNNPFLIIGILIVTGFVLLDKIPTKTFYYLIAKEWLRFVRFADSQSITDDLHVNFQADDRYFPKSIIQIASPKFLWDNFSSYDKKLWGDNQHGRIKTQSFNDNSGQVILGEKEMIWLLYRLSYGTVEFRWMDVQNAIHDENSDKYFGFGDPGEGFAAGFRLHSVDNQPVALYAETINYGQTYRTLIPWRDDYIRARYFVEWGKERIQYSVGDNSFSVVAVHQPKDLPPVGLPTVRMEISVQNLSGSTAVVLPLMKYDAQE